MNARKQCSNETVVMDVFALNKGKKRVFPSAVIKSSKKGEGYVVEKNVIYPAFYFAFKPL